MISIPQPTAADIEHHTADVRADHPDWDDEALIARCGHIRAERVVQGRPARMTDEAYRRVARIVAAGVDTQDAS